MKTYIGFIGCGNMGGALAKAAAKSELLTPEQIFLADPYQAEKNFKIKLMSGREQLGNLAAKLDAFVDSKGVIFDGFPRTIAQAVALKELLNSRGQDVTAMIELDVPEEELMTRLLKRGQESGRADDNEETIKKRLVVYAEQTAPLKDWYKNDGKHCYINGLGELDRIFADIVAAIDSKI